MEIFPISYLSKEEYNMIWNKIVRLKFTGPDFASRWMNSLS